MRVKKAYDNDRPSDWSKLFCHFTIVALILVAGTVTAYADTVKNGTTFQDKAVTIELPAGWNIKAPPPGDKETIATFTSDKYPGTSVIALAEKGVFIKYSYARIRMLKNVAAAYPGGQEQLKDQHKIKTDNGLKVWLELWRGIPSVENKNIVLTSPTAIFKSKSKYWIILIGFAPESNGEWLENEMLKMVQAAK